VRLAALPAFGRTAWLDDIAGAPRSTLGEWGWERATDDGRSGGDAVVHARDNDAVVHTRDKSRQ